MNMGAFAVLLLLLSSTYTCTAGTDQNLIVETKSGKVKINHLIPPYHHFVHVLSILKVLGKYSGDGNSRVEEIIIHRMV